MTNKKQNGISKASIIFYVVAVIFLLIAAFSIYQAHAIIQINKTQYAMKFTDVLNVYLQGVAPSFGFAFILYGIGVVLNKFNDMNSSLQLCVNDAVESQTKSGNKKDASNDLIKDLKSVSKAQEVKKAKANTDNKTK